MNLREFEITLSPSGAVEIHADGFKGSGCLEALRVFEQILGPAGEVRNTMAFYEPPDEVHLDAQQHH